MEVGFMMDNRATADMNWTQAMITVDAGNWMGEASDQIWALHPGNLRVHPTYDKISVSSINLPFLLFSFLPLGHWKGACARVGGGGARERLLA